MPIVFVLAAPTRPTHLVARSAWLATSHTFLHHLPICSCQVALLAIGCDPLSLHLLDLPDRACDQLLLPFGQVAQYHCCALPFVGLLLRYETGPHSCQIILQLWMTALVCWCLLCHSLSVSDLFLSLLNLRCSLFINVWPQLHMKRHWHSDIVLDHKKLTNRKSMFAQMHAVV